MMAMMAKTEFHATITSSPRQASLGLGDASHVYMNIKSYVACGHGSYIGLRLFQKKKRRRLGTSKLGHHWPAIIVLCCRTLTERFRCYLKISQTSGFDPLLLVVSTLQVSVD